MLQIQIIMQAKLNPSPDHLNFTFLFCYGLLTPKLFLKISISVVRCFFVIFFLAASLVLF